MLILNLKEKEYFDSQKNEFINCKPCTLKLEHSLISLSKWEAKYKKPFLSEKNSVLDPDEFLDYIRCMTINQDVPDNVYSTLDYDDLKKISNYITDPATATTIVDRRKSHGRVGEVMTSEYIYYLMFSNGIPIECEKWQLNRLIMLIRIFSVKGNPQQMSRNEIYAMNAALNASRRKK